MSLCVCMRCLVVSDSLRTHGLLPSAHGILQAVVLEWVSIPFSRGSSQPRDWTQVSCIAGKFFTVWATREAHMSLYICHNHRMCNTNSEPWSKLWPLVQWCWSIHCSKHIPLMRVTCWLGGRLSMGGGGRCVWELSFLSTQFCCEPETLLKIKSFFFFFYKHWSEVKWKSFSRVQLFATPRTVILQARILEWVAFPFSRGSSQPRNQTQVSRIAEPQGKPSINTIQDK